jgi:pSer/pThr/pTyr-binding forkhead associated (FHA) protein
MGMQVNDFTGAELVVETGPLAGTRFLLDRQLVTIGRAGDNDIQLDDEMVSKNHCRIITQGDNFLIEDLASSNGTIVNGDQVNTHMMQDGDKLFLGQTTLLFRKAAPAAAAAAAQAVKPSKRKAIWIGVGVLGGLVVIAGAVVVLLFVILQTSDSIKPRVEIKTPSGGQVIEMNMPAVNKLPVAITMSASDNKGLDRVEIYINGNVFKTLKATRSRREDKTSGPEKQEDFSATWDTNTPGEYAIAAKAYDWKGNIGEAAPITVKIQHSAALMAANEYCQQIDRMIGEFVGYHARFSNAYGGAQKGTVSYDEAGKTFYEVEQQRRALLDSLNKMTPPAPFVNAQGLFANQIDSAIKADQAAEAWAGYMYSSTYYPTEYGYTSSADAAKSEVDGYSAETQKCGAEFQAEYNKQRADQLGIGPGPNPNG